MSKKIIVSAGGLRFEKRFDPVRILPILASVQTLCKVLNETPLLPEDEAALAGDLRLRSLHASASLSGNALGLDETARVLERQAQSAAEAPAAGEAAGRPDRMAGTRDAPELDPAARELANLARASRKVAGPWPDPGSLELTEPLLLRAHSLVVDGMGYPLTEPGGYRMRSIEVGDEDQGGCYVPPRSASEVRSLVRRLMDFINAEPQRRDPAPLRAALFHFYYSAIHPFEGGNARTGRLVEALMLSAAGLKFAPWLLAIQAARAPLAGFQAFLRALADPAGNLTPWLEHVLAGLAVGLEECRVRAFSSLAAAAKAHRVEILKERRAINARQAELFRVIRERDQPVRLRDILTHAAFRSLYKGLTAHTARRDLNVMLRLHLLARTGRTFTAS